VPDEDDFVDSARHEYALFYWKKPPAALFRTVLSLPSAKGVTFADCAVPPRTVPSLPPAKGVTFAGCAVTGRYERASL
jgi:hypothetical protein